MESSSTRIVGRSPSIRNAVKGSSLRTVGARPPVWRGELVNENSREEPVCLKYSEGLVIVNNRSSSFRAEWRARQRE